MPAEGWGGKVEGRAFQHLLELAVIDELYKAQGEFFLGRVHGLGLLSCVFPVAWEEEQERQEQDKSGFSHIRLPEVLDEL